MYFAAMIKFGRARPEQLLAIAFALARTAFCAYRALTQALVHDEAFFFDRFVDGAWSQIWAPYDAANHVLYSVLAKVSITLFGLSEFTLRLPSVLAGFALMIATFAILSTCRSRILRWTVYVAIGLHPLLLDFSIAARGYGLSLTLLAWAIYATMRNRPIRAGFLAGLAISANLTVLVPVAALMLARFLQTEGGWRPRTRQTAMLALPVIITAAAICYLPLRTATRASYYVGFDSLKDSLFNLTYSSLHASVREGLLGSFETARVVAYAVVPLVLALGLAIGIASWGADVKLRYRLIAPLTLAISLPILLALHGVFDVKYPVDRTGLYLMYLAGISWALIADAGRRLGSSVGVLIALLLLIQFATQLQAHLFEVWGYDADIKEVVRRIQQECRDKPAGAVSVSVSAVHQPALEFYRKYDRIACAQPFDWNVPTQFTGHDYYVYNRGDRNVSEAVGLQVLISEPVSGIILAK
jgi:hypothetical protein